MKIQGHPIGRDWPMEDTEYFASANTAIGFDNLFSEAFRIGRIKEGDRLYIIKGGPGTGKSYLMEEVANEGRNRGMTVERMLCSSDPDSLDGVRLTDPSSARTLTVTDGTAPHICDPIFPGAYDSIIHLGEFWNGGKLSARLEDIKRLNEQKKALYALAYRYLAAAGAAHRECCLYASQAYLAHKASEAVGRLMKGIEKGDKGDVRRIYTESIGMKGVHRLPSFHRADRVYLVDDRYGAGGDFMKALTAALAEKGRMQVVAGHILAPDVPSAVYLPGQNGGESAAFILCDRTGLTAKAEEVMAASDAHVINMERFTDKSMLTGRESRVRGRYRFAAEMRGRLIEAAADTFVQIRQVHFALEDIYRGAMDFGKKEAYTKKLLIRMFGEL